MSYIIGKACIGIKDGACVEVCPVDCIFEGEESMYINPNDCINCGVCEPECPVEAIYDDEKTAIEAGELEAVKNNYKFFNLKYE